MVESWCISLGNACDGFAQAMDILGKPRRAVWFRCAARAYGRGWCTIGRLCKQVAGWGLYRSDWEDILLLHRYGRI